MNLNNVTLYSLMLKGIFANVPVLGKTGIMIDGITNFPVKGSAQQSLNSNAIDWLLFRVFKSQIYVIYMYRLL